MDGMGWRGVAAGLCLFVCLLSTVTFFNPHPRTCLLILEAGNGGRGREGDRERNIDQLPFVCVPTKDRSSMPQPGQNPQPRHVPWPGIHPATFRFAGWCSSRVSHTGQSGTVWCFKTRAGIILLETKLTYKSRGTIFLQGKSSNFLWTFPVCLVKMSTVILNIDTAGKS